MMRLIRWLCFPIAARLNTWPIAVYYIIVLALIGLRTMLRGGPDYLLRLPQEWTAEMDPVLAAYLLPAVYILTLIIFPLYAYLFDKRWYRKAS